MFAEQRSLRFGYLGRVGEKIARLPCFHTTHTFAQLMTRLLTGTTWRANDSITTTLP